MQEKELHLYIKLNNNDQLEMRDRDLLVNGRPFKVITPNEPLFGVKEGKLITIVFRGCGCTLSEWDPEEIEGEFDY